MRRSVTMTASEETDPFFRDLFDRDGFRRPKNRVPHCVPSWAQLQVEGLPRICSPYQLLACALI